VQFLRLEAAGSAGLPVDACATFDFTGVWLALKEPIGGNMFSKARYLVPLIVVTSALTMLAALPAVAAQPAPMAMTPIDDVSGDTAAPGVNVIRNVSNDEVIVRLNNGDRQAHFKIFFQGVEVASIDDDGFPFGWDLETGWDDGVYGGCDDELLIDPARGYAALAKFYTCPNPDTIRLHLGDFIPCRVPDMHSPHMRIVFTGDVLVNTEGVFVGDDPTNVGSSWIPLYE